MSESVQQIQMQGLGPTLNATLAKGDKMCFQHSQ